MAATYYLKENPASPLIIGGAAVPFDIHGEHGYLSIDPDSGPQQAKLFKSLEESVNEHRGGVVRIPKDAFEQKKNLPPSQNSRPASPWQSPPRLLPRASSQAAQQPHENPVAVAARAEVNARLKELGITVPGVNAPANPAITQAQKLKKIAMRRAPTEAEIKAIVDFAKADQQSQKEVSEIEDILGTPAEQPSAETPAPVVEETPRPATKRVDVNTTETENANVG